jgi:serine/threonine-protein kinase
MNAIPDGLEPETLAPGDYALVSTGASMTERTSRGLEPTLLKDDPAAVPPTLPAESGTRLAPEASERVLIVPGALVDGTYRVLRELGRGAMGLVALAHDERLDRRVALKLIRPELAAPRFRNLFLQEARAMARVNHRNVVRIYTSGEHEEIPYFAMEFVNGETLEEWFEHRGRRVDVDTAVSILTEVCRGVSAIHDANTLHRDIKPSNILLDAELRPRIADLGVSTLYREGRLNRPEIVGTPAYMAPEVAFPMAGQSPTPKVDVYSLACVAYELLTGQSPFSANNDNDWVMKHATQSVPAPSSVRADLPPAFDRALLRALAKDPDLRTPTVEEFRRDLVSAAGTSEEPVRILVAEDDPDFRELLGFELRRHFPDAEVETVGTGLAALEALDLRAASVAILDLNMPDLDGIQVTRLLRARVASSAMPIIVLTGSGGPAEWRELSSIGADRFLVKPVHLDDLVTSVRHSLRERTKGAQGPDSSQAPPTPRSAHQ